MLEIRPSHPEEWQDCKALWQAAFGDSDAYIDNYYVNHYAPEKVLLLKDEDGVRSMLALFDLEQRWGDGGTTKAAYLYALATHPEARGKGYAGFLLAYTDFYLQNRAVPFLSTVPAQPSLEKFFGSHGFQPCHPLDEYAGPLPKGLHQPGRVCPVTAEEYHALREGLLVGMAHAIYPAEYLDYQSKVCALSGGNLYRVETSCGPACAVAFAEEGVLDVRELLCSAGAQAQAVAALATLWPVETCRVRTPAGRGEFPGTCTKTFGMAKRVPTADTTLEPSYFALAFD